jgi:hypothetical protein
LNVVVARSAEPVVDALRKPLPKFRILSNGRFAASFGGCLLKIGLTLRRRTPSPRPLSPVFASAVSATARFAFDIQIKTIGQFL